MKVIKTGILKTALFNNYNNFKSLNYVYNFHNNGFKKTPDLRVINI